MMGQGGAGGHGRGAITLPPGWVLQPGFAPAERAQVAGLYWQAFGGKLGRVLAPRARALCYLEQVLRPDHALVIRDPAGVIRALAGFRSPEGSLAEGGHAALARAYGRWGGGLRAGLLALMAHDIDNERFLVDGLCVAPAARRQGLGLALIEALCAEARARGYRLLRLDVHAANAPARRLYARAGFRQVARQSSALGGLLFGTGRILVLVRDL